MIFMRKSTFQEFAEVASKEYSSQARKSLEETLNHFAKETTSDVVRQLGLPQVLMFFSSTIAKQNQNKVIQNTDVEEAFSLLQYLLERDLNSTLLVNDELNLGLPFAMRQQNRLAILLKVKGNMKTKNNLDSKISRLVDFLKSQKLAQKHINRIVTELKATILFIARLLTLTRSARRLQVSNEDIDFAYDFARYLILRFDLTKIKILTTLYSVEDKEIWGKFSKIVFDTTAHDHLSSTAYAGWENDLPEAFETLKQYINCGSRLFVSAIFGYSEIFCARKKISRVTTDELTIILEDFEKAVFGDTNPLIIEDRGLRLSFTRESLDLFKHISDWLTSLLIRIFGKDKFVFDFAATVPRQMSLLLFLSIVAVVIANDQKIDISHILFAVKKWASYLKLLVMVPQ